MTFKINDSQDQWPNQVSLVQADAVHTVPVYDANVSQNDLPSRASRYRFPAESTGNMMRPWRKGVARVVPALQRMSAHFHEQQTTLQPVTAFLLQPKWSSCAPCNELQGMQCSPRPQHCPSLHVRINSLSPGQTGAASRRPLHGVHLFWWPCGVTYRKVIQGYFWKSETKQKTIRKLTFQWVSKNCVTWHVQYKNRKCSG